jgi:hypothetical protein
MNALVNGSEPRYKIKIESTRYIIHPHNKAIVCIMECSMPELPRIPKVSDKYFSNTTHCYNFNNNFEVKGVAKCGPGDEYNEELGMKIAESKATMKAFDKVRRVLEEYKDIIGKEWDKANTSVDFFEQMLGRECMHFESLTR